VAASILVPLMLFAYVAFLERRNAFRQADERLEYTLNIVQEHTLKMLETVERAIAEVDEVTAGWNDPTILMRESMLHARLARIAKALPYVQTIGIVAADGRIQASSRTYPVPIVSLAERDYFKALSKADLGTFIDRVYAPTFSSQPYFSVVRRRTTADNSFDGVIVVSMLPSYLSDFYARVAHANGEGAAIVLLRSDGVVLARHPQTANATTVLPPDGRLMRSIAVNADGGTYEGASAIDGIERRMAYRRLPNTGIYTHASIPFAAIESQWYATLWSHIVFGVPATLLLIALSGLALIRTRALYVEMDARERAEGALRQAQRLEAVGQLTGGIAHDFNNLLMVMTGGVDRLRRDIKDPKQVRTLDMIQSAAKRGENLIRHLLTFSRKQATNPTLVDIAHFLGQIDEVLRGTLRGNIQLGVEPPKEACVIHVDAGEFELALLNLAVNARDAMPRGGRLILSARPLMLGGDDDGLVGEFVAIDVTDTGEGIAPDALPKVFEPFFTTKPAGQGTGLGLSQVYGFAKQAGGTVRIATVQGRGTTVTILVPRASAQEIAQQAPLPAPNKARILLVEDSDEVAQVTSDYLERLGHVVEIAMMARDALSELRRRSDFDLVLSDIVMPGEMDGLDLARRVRAEHRDLPIVLVTGYSASADAARREGFEVLRKPYTLDRLAQAIESHLARPPHAAAS
jgi:two-component system NtrC family sensor kinase